MLTALFVVLSAAPQPWRLERGGLTVAVACTRPLSESARDAAAKNFAAPRSLHSNLLPRAALSQLDLKKPCLSFDGLDSTERAQFERVAKVQVLGFSWPSADAAALGLAYAAIGAVADSCRGVVVDLVTLNAFSRERWQAARVAKAGPAPRAPEHFAIHAVPQDDGSLLLDTGGLARFALADLVLEHVPRSGQRSVGTMLNVLVQRLIEGAQADGKGRVLVKLDELREPAFRKQTIDSAFPNARRELLVGFTASPGTGELRPGTWVLGFPALTCDEPAVCLQRAHDELLGWKDEVTDVEHSAKVLAASDRARAALQALQPRFQHGLPDETSLLVKAPFSTAHRGREWMWVEVKTWKNGVLKGSLNSEPEDVPSLKAGSTCEVQEADVFDYMYELGDGSFYGNETGKVMAPEKFEDLGDGRSRVR